MKIFVAVIAATALLFSAGALFAQTQSPRLAPDSTWVGGKPQLAPDGSWVGGKPKLAPDGTWVGVPDGD